MSEDRYKSLLLFGPPGVGKGTQGKILSTVPGLFHLSTGDVFRSLDVGSVDGQEVSETISRGELVPDDLTIRIWRKGLNGLIAMSRYKPHEDILVLDGIPRSVPQAELLKEHIDVLGIVYLECSDESAMITRIKRRAIKENRADDANEEVIRRRYEIYHNESAPVLDCYSKGLIARVDAMGSPAEVLQQILAYVIPIQNAHFHGEDV
jgi:adenylate kinase